MNGSRTDGTPSTRLFGLETEYGITREDLDAMDPVVESMELVRAHLLGRFERRWDYGGEDPHADARGFRADRLQQDREEDEFAEQDRHRPFSFHEMKSDLVLENGARFYNDHTHPEYSTPECRSLLDLIAQDRAGERIVQAAAESRNRRLGGPYVQLYKNNTDFHGHSYGCHDNYLMPRSVRFERIVTGLLPFLVSRQVIAGAGKVGIEGQAHGFEPGRYQLSQRADFMETDLSVDTMHNRPILNTRDEPHADARRYRRLHLIVGDANMCEYATALKVGTTRLVLDLIHQDAAPNLVLEDPVQAIRAISRDPDLKQAVRRRTGGMMTGLELQRAYHEAAGRHLSGRDAETDWIIAEWGQTLTSLTTDRARLIGRLDWLTKQWLLETFLREENLRWDDPWMASLDLEYHNVNPERGLFAGLEGQGKAFRLTTEAAVATAVTEGPADTRGGVRGLCISRFGEQITSVQWEQVRFRGDAPLTLDLRDLFDADAVAALRAIVTSAESPRLALAQWQKGKEHHERNHL